MRERAKREKTKTSEEKARVCRFFELREYKTLRVNSSMRVFFKSMSKTIAILRPIAKEFEY